MKRRAPSIKEGAKHMAAGSCEGDGRGMPPVRVLVVEDYEPFRRFVCSTLVKIRKLSPESKILFVSQGTSAGVVQETRGSGAVRLRRQPTL